MKRGKTRRTRSDELLETSIRRLPTPDRRVLRRLLAGGGPGVSTESIIVQRLGSNIGSTREQAALCFVCGQITLKEAGPALILTFRRARSPLLAWEAAKALVAVRPRGFRAALRRALTSDRSTTKRAAAAWALGNAGKSPGAVTALVSVLQDPETPETVRDVACEAVGMIGGRSAIPILRACLAAKSPEVRASAAYALGVMRVKKALPELSHLAASDHGRVEGVGTVSSAARRAIDHIAGH